MNLRRDKPTTYLGMSGTGTGIAKSSSITTLPMTAEEKAAAKEREINKPPFGFGVR